MVPRPTCEMEARRKSRIAFRYGEWKPFLTCISGKLSYFLRTVSNFELALAFGGDFFAIENTALSGWHHNLEQGEGIASFHASSQGGFCSMSTVYLTVLQPRKSGLRHIVAWLSFVVICSRS